MTEQHLIGEGELTSSDEGPEVELPGAFELFYRDEYARAVAVAYGVSGSWSVAEDLAQEAFLRAHSDWDRVKKMNSPSGWVRRVVLNLSYSHYRRLRSEARALMRLGSPRRVEPTIEAEDEAFWNEVRGLPRRQAQVIALFYVGGMTIRQISHALSIAEGSVKALLSQGRERLRRQLLAKGVVDGL